MPDFLTLVSLHLEPVRVATAGVSSLLQLDFFVNSLSEPKRRCNQSSVCIGVRAVDKTAAQAPD